MRRLLLLLFLVLSSLSLFFFFPKKSVTPKPDQQNSSFLEVLKLSDKIKPLYSHLPQILGFKTPFRILVLLGNDQEIRANMGFPGSYAMITMHCQLSIVNCPLDVRFADIYTPSGQIQGHVEPPPMIQQAFQQGEWLLPNFDVDPDFTISATSLRWFMEKAGEEKADLIVTLNLQTIKDIMRIIGPIKIDQFNIDLDQNNIYSFLQNQAENNFFPGSTQKKDALSLVGKHLVNKIESLDNSQKISVIKLLFDELDRTNIVVNALDKDIQSFFSQSKWSGETLKDIKSTDFYYLNEMNLGANKANCCVSRNTKHIISRNTPNEAFGEVGQIHHEIKFTLTNSSPLENPDPPRFYGGNYLSFLRFYIPSSATNVIIKSISNKPSPKYKYPTLDSPTIPPGVYPANGGEGGNSKGVYQEISLFHLTSAASSSTVELSYDLPELPIANYQFSILKQNGLRSSPQSINLFGETFTTELKESFILP